MVNGKSWAILAAVAAVAFNGAVHAESSVAGASSPNALTLTAPVAAQAAPAQRPLTRGLDAIGAAKPLADARIDIGGYVSGSLTYFVDPAQGKIQPGRGFDSENQDVTLNQAGIFVERTVDSKKAEFDVGGKIESIYGADARFTKSTGLFDHQGVNDGPNNQYDLVQAYADVVLPVGNGLKLRVGKFVTGAGVEVINPTGNALYSPGLLFTYLLPFTHTGATGTYNISDTWALELGVVRGWDDALEDKNGNGVSFYARSSNALNDNKSNVYTTFIAGPEYAGNTNDYRYLLDVVYTVAYSDNWTFAVQADALFESNVDPVGGSSDLGFAGGLGGWATYKYSQYVSVTGRGEYLYDGQGFRFSPPVFGDFNGDGTTVQAPGTGEGNNIYSATVGLTITPFPTDNLGSNLKIRPEFRYDYADQAVFGGDNNQVTFAIEAYFTF